MGWKKRSHVHGFLGALGRSVDYVQVCDSDTILDPASSVEMVKVLEEDPMVGGVGGDVQILNKYDSWISFLSSVRYWMAFNIERACQSYFGCVQCISGPLRECTETPYCRNLWKTGTIKNLWAAIVVFGMTGT